MKTFTHIILQEGKLNTTYREHTFKIKVADAGLEVRCWVEQKSTQRHDIHKVLAVIKTLQQDLVTQMKNSSGVNTATLYCQQLAEAILEVENMNAVEVISTVHTDLQLNISIQNPGVVLYKNWP